MPRLPRSCPVDAADMPSPLFLAASKPGQPGPWIKVCGFVDTATAVSAAEAGVDWIGLNLHPPSRRYVDRERARELARAIVGVAEPVALFVDRPPDEVACAAESIGVSIIQLHGDEPPEDVRVLRRRGFSVVRAFRIGSLDDVASLSRWLDEAEALGGRPDAILLDARVHGMVGGTGKRIPSEVLHAAMGLRCQGASPVGRIPPIAISGGLNAESVAGVVTTHGPWMVDVASGVESSPGKKDLGLITQFIRAARRASVQ